MNIPQDEPAKFGSDLVRQLDVRGQDCPMPALEARRCLDDMVSGQVLEILATDPLAELDLQILCERLAHEWLGARDLLGERVIRIRVRQSPRAGAD